jgi:exodeoxyribonuclease VII small subunit
MTKNDKKEPNFEKSFQRLEEILETMNAGDVGLDESLKLYEEANQLIITCGKRLNEAEQTIEKLIKSRDGELILSEEGKPTTEPFEP